VRSIFGVLTLLLLLAGPVPAHDFWMQPETFTPALRRPIALRIFVGDGLEIETERSFEKKPTIRFQALSAAGARDLMSTGTEGKKPFASLTFDMAGSHWIGLERERKTIRIEADKFNEYLAEEGLDKVLEQRRLAKEDRKPGRERYSRYLKCLVQAGDTRDEAWKKQFGHRLEIVPQVDPSTLKTGDSFKVRVLFEGKPLANVPLFALNRKDSEKARSQKLVTAADGTAEVKLSRAGMWLVRLVHMRRCPDTDEADWESFWSALTFAIH
jgi:uncharacterized GH25 family protein